MMDDPPSIHRNRTIALPPPAKVAHSVIDLTANGVAVFALAPGSKHPLRGSNGFTDATGDTCSALATLVACTGYEARADRFNMPDAEAKRVFAQALAAASVHEFGRCADNAGRIAFYERLTHEAVNVGLPDTGATYCVEPPRLNLGIRTGPVSGLLVIDYDPRHDPDGLQWREFIGLTGGLPDTLAVRTPSGGWHFYFPWHDALDHVAHRAKLAQQVTGEAVFGAFDVKGRNGYVLAVPSAIRHKKASKDRPAVAGGCYSFSGIHTYADLRAGAAPLPDVLLERLVTRQKLRMDTGASVRNGAAIPEALAGLAVTPEDLGGTGALPDTPANREWLDALIDFAFTSRRCNARGGWDRNDWWFTLAAILSTEWHDARALAQGVSRRDVTGWDAAGFETQCDSLIERMERDAANLLTWRGWRWRLRERGWRGRLNPPDLPPGDRLVTRGLADAELLEELLGARRCAIVTWVATHGEAWERIKPALKKRVAPA